MWHSIKEKLPDGGKAVLAFDGEDMAVCLYFPGCNEYPKSWVLDTKLQQEVFRVSHWAELPTPPQTIK